MSEPLSREETEAMREALEYDPSQPSYYMNRRWLATLDVRDALLRDLVENWVHDTHDGPKCIHCGAPATLPLSPATDGWVADHADECPVGRAEALLGGE